MFPDLPTVAESGLPGFDAVLTYGLVAPAGTPRPIVERLNRELRAALATDEVKRRLMQEGAEPMPTTPEEHAAVIDREETKWAAVIKSIGFEGAMSFRPHAAGRYPRSRRLRWRPSWRRSRPPRRTIPPGRSR